MLQEARRMHGPDLTLVTCSRWMCLETCGDGDRAPGSLCSLGLCWLQRSVQGGISSCPHAGKVEVMHVNESHQSLAGVRHIFCSNSFSENEGGASHHFGGLEIAAHNRAVIDRCSVPVAYLHGEDLASHLHQFQYCTVSCLWFCSVHQPQGRVWHAHPPFVPARHSFDLNGGVP